MNSIPREIKFLTKLNILKKKPISMLIGFLSTMIPIFLVIVLSTLFSSLANESIDYDLIKSEGKELTAKITDIETQYNTTINGVHPTTISYVYFKNGKGISSTYKVLEERKIANLKIGDSLEILELNEISIIKNLKPFDFSIGEILLSLIPLMIIGLPFLLYSIYHFRKELRLYKFGKVIEAKLISMIPKSGMPVSNIGHGVIVHYEYVNKNGEKIIGESFTTDVSFVSEKKKDDWISIFVSDENENNTCIVPKLGSLRNGWNVEF